MKTDLTISGALALIVIFGLLAPFPSRAVEGAEGITAVASRVSKDYVRTKLPDGSFQRETYAFGKGGDSGGPIRDETIDKLGFMDIARIIAVPLAGQNYFPAKDPNKTKLLIMLYWGTTDGPGPLRESPVYETYRSEMQEANLLLQTGATDAGDALMSAALSLLEMEQSRRARIDYRNANLLGYNSPDGEALIGTSEGNLREFTALRHSANSADDLIPEIEVSRYFVVLLAYDFELMWKKKTHKLLWETRFSINQPRNDFGKALPVMAATASKYFGQQSHGLVRQVIPEGHVEVHEPILIELLDELQDRPKK